MALLDAGELADLRADMTETLSDTAQVLRKALTDNGGGRQAAAYASAGGPLPCRFWNKQSPRDMADIVVGGGDAKQMASIILWYVLLPWDADVRPADRLAMNSGTSQAMTLEVAGTDSGRTEGIGQTVICRAIS